MSACAIQSGYLPDFLSCTQKEPGGRLIAIVMDINTVEYQEGIYVGYRYFDTHDRDVFFPFGFGLSYTTFEFSGLDLDVKDGVVRIRATVTNTGDREGAEVVQVDVHHKNPPVDRPVRELKGFEKVHLAAGSSATVEIELDETAFSFFHPDEHKWVTEPGTCQIQLGSSSRDIRLTGDVEL